MRINWKALGYSGLTVGGIWGLALGIYHIPALIWFSILIIVMVALFSLFFDEV